ncbi:MAG: undecaprenyl/decaprenyl-phosphate alpha-N-acetylglucosaminyl 1-phosphate transferase, partial [Tissierellales bacterium]
VVGQIGLGVLVGATMYFHPDITIREKLNQSVVIEQSAESFTQTSSYGEKHKSTKTTIPFFKKNEFDYASLVTWIEPGLAKYAWIIFIPVVIFIVTAVSNGANLTDGLDGLAAGTSAIAVLALAIFTWVSGNIIFSDYLNVMNIPNSGEMTVFIAALVGALIGFLWYNTYPAQIFMGDTGALLLGFILAAISIEGVMKSVAAIAVIVPLIILGLPIFDTTLAIFRRFLNGKSIAEADRGHLHHKLLERGYSQQKTVLILYAISLVFSLMAILVSKVNSQRAIIFSMSVFIVAVILAVKMGLISSKGEDKE